MNIAEFLIFYGVGALITAGAIATLPRRPESKGQWAFAIGLWPFTLFAMMAAGR